MLQVIEQHQHQQEQKSRSERQRGCRQANISCTEASRVQVCYTSQRNEITKSITTLAGCWTRAAGTTARYGTVRCGAVQIYGTVRNSTNLKYGLKLRYNTLLKGLYQCVEKTSYPDFEKQYLRPQESCTVP